MFVKIPNALFSHTKVNCVDCKRHYGLKDISDFMQIWNQTLFLVLILGNRMLWGLTICECRAPPNKSGPGPIRLLKFHSLQILVYNGANLKTCHTHILILVTLVVKGIKI